jgi:hypothetical protein
MGSRNKDRDQDRSRDQLAVTSKLDSLVSQTRSFGFFSLRTEEGFKDYYAQDSSSTSLVSSRSHALQEDEDSMDEGIEDVGRSDREGER